MIKEISVRPSGVIVGLNFSYDEATQFAKSTGYQIERFVLFDNSHEYEEFNLYFQGKVPTTREIILEEFYQAVLKAEEDFGHYFLQFSATVGIAKTTCTKKLAALKANPD